MLQDRPYMRDSYERRSTSVVTWLLCSVAAVFVLQNVFSRWLHIGLEWSFGLSPVGLKGGHIWTLLTYGFLHDTSNLLQVIAYLLVIFFFGREVLPVLGTRRFMAFYAAALLAGGAFWLAVHWRHPEILLGASAAVSALVILYACFYPNREITLLLFFVMPVTLKPKYLAYAMIAFDLFGFAFYELYGAASPFGAAHSAHLGGMAVGWIYYRYVHDSDWSLASERADIELPRWMRRKNGAKPAKAAPTYSVDISDRSHLRAEVDRILDKINSHGFGSLSADEKRVLDEARDLISRR